MRPSFSATSLAILSITALAGCGRPPVLVSNDRPSLLAARAALSEGEAGTALAIARGVLSSQPNNVGALVQAADAEVALGDRLTAKATYEQALSLEPRDLRARLGMGKLQVRDDVHAAEATFRTILADAPTNPIVLNDLGYTLDLQGRHTEAQAEYQAALAADPNRFSTRVNLALSLALSGHADEAVPMLRDAAESAGSTTKVRLDLATAEVIAGQDKEAIETLQSDMSPDQTKSTVEAMQQLRPMQVSAVVPAKTTRLMVTTP